MTGLRRESKRIRDPTWDFSGENTKISIHGIHTYPAMMIPQIAKRLMEEYGKESKMNLDPFCGSGTVLVESMLHNINSYGVDINPLAILLSKVKTTPINHSELEKEFIRICDRIREARWKPEIIQKIETPNFFNIEYWFKPKVIRELSFIKQIIDNIEDEVVRNFFYVSFSETVRKVSNTRGGEYKLFRIPENKLKEWNPDALSTFLEISERNIKMMREFYSSVDIQRIQKGELWSKVLMEDMRAKTSIPENSVDFIATSPPYGDSRTTVAYGQFSRLTLQWLDYDYDIVKRIDKISLGGIRPKKIKDDVPSDTLYNTLEKISKNDGKRALDVYSFFSDFNKTVDEINRITMENAFVCIVVGNRTVKKINIPTDIILFELFEDRGYTHLKTIVRQIPSKRLPKKSSPSNIKGDAVSTMNFEYIVILKK
jgi:DNA modification methylase